MMNSSPESTCFLGCIADDVTGATDLAINLVQGGFRVVQFLGVPTPDSIRECNADAVVIALKSRSIPCREAIKLSLASLQSLRNAGCQRFYFKYCSTFDSTATGNIGPVAEALMDEIGINQTIYCPAFPAAGRTVYQGHLFVFDQLLNESGMENHPLNPMDDANLVRFLGNQTQRKVGNLRLQEQFGSLTSQLDELEQAGISNVITDACSESDLDRIAEAVIDFPLVTGGSGLAKSLPAAYRSASLLEPASHKPHLPKVGGRSAILAGSCSKATNAQVQWMEDRCPVYKPDLNRLIDNHESELDTAICWAKKHLADDPILFASTQDATQLAATQARFGSDKIATQIEIFFGKLAKQLVDQFQVRKLVVAGGETSGAVVAALDIQGLRIGPEISTGVPWTETISSSTPQTPQLALALKSGNFGEQDFFESALGMLP
ncbi:MAG: 3-oxo-tetronate kinase [Aureliella sp.]